MTTRGRATPCLRPPTRPNRPGTSWIRTTSAAARLNCIAHLLSLVPYQEVPHEKVKLPKRQPKGDYVEPDYPFRRIPEKY